MTAGTQLFGLQSNLQTHDCKQHFPSIHAPTPGCLCSTATLLRWERYIAKAVCFCTSAN